MLASTSMGISVEKQLRARYYKLCDPRESLPHDDKRLVFDGAVAKARGRDWVEKLAGQVELSQLSGGAAFELFTGLPGSGKSTELHRLKARLEEREGAHLLAVLIDAEGVIDLFNTIDVPDILVAILAETERRVLEAEGEDPSNALKDGALRRFWNWLTETEVELKEVAATAGVDVGLPGVGKASVGGRLVLDLKTRPLLRAKVRATLDGQLTPFIAQIMEAIGELDGRAKAAGYEGLVVIFDSLEKLQGTTSNWKDVLASAEQVFANRAAQLHLPVHVLYTIPMALILRIRASVTLLPMLKLHERDGEPAAGFEAARELIRRRIPDEHLDEFFGAPNREARVKRLIEWSGGYPREIVRLLRNCVAEPFLDEELFERILSTAADEYRRTVLSSAYPLLARLFVDKPSQVLEQEEQREMVDRLLQNNVVLGYLNGEPWYDIHPAVQTLKGITDEIARLRAERAGAGRR